MSILPAAIRICINLGYNITELIKLPDYQYICDYCLHKYVSEKELTYIIQTVMEEHDNLLIHSIWVELNQEPLL